MEVRHGGSWGTVCDDGFGQAEADVICRQLGFGPAKQGYRVGYFHNAHFGRGSGPILMDGLQCTGAELALADCPFRGWGSYSYCGHYEDAGVACHSPPPPATPPPPPAPPAHALYPSQLLLLRGF